MSATAQREPLDPYTSRQTLLHALRDPFLWDGNPEPLFERPLSRWYEALIWHCPLLTLQAGAYHSTHLVFLPSTHPLDQFVASIIRDEGIPTEFDSFVDPLQANLDERRVALSEQRALCVATTHPETLKRRRSPLLKAGRDWPYREDEYLELGEQLVRHVDARLGAAKGTPEEEQAKAELKEFLEQIAARHRRGAPVVGVTKAAMKALYREVKAILEVLWPIQSWAPSARTRDLLAKSGAGDEAEQREWVLRLAVPVLSRAELLATLDQAAQERSWTKTGGRPTPRRFSVWILAHRLSIRPVSVADKIGFGSDRYLFEGDPPTNPIDAFLQ